ncbi:hypothetical protein E2C01_056938 [Portunus trituberculatus]|uniref:Uncharacterized protein n=1 Tax=Portunus trituberculatus TaxID=210409 RepID=A0A5B7H0Y5_PORTR|nr:hypothetical protein [Portunus trituberculatus]
MDLAAFEQKLRQTLECKAGNVVIQPTNQLAETEAEEGAGAEAEAEAETEAGAEAETEAKAQAEIEAEAHAKTETVVSTFQNSKRSVFWLIKDNVRQQHG